MTLFAVIVLIGSLLLFNAGLQWLTARLPQRKPSKHSLQRRRRQLIAHGMGLMGVFALGVVMLVFELWAVELAALLLFGIFPLYSMFVLSRLVRLVDDETHLHERPNHAADARPPRRDLDGQLDAVDDNWQEDETQMQLGKRKR